MYDLDSFFTQNKEPQKKKKAKKKVGAKPQLNQKKTKHLEQPNVLMGPGGRLKRGVPEKKDTGFLADLFNLSKLKEIYHKAKGEGQEDSRYKGDEIATPETKKKMGAAENIHSKKAEVKYDPSLKAKTEEQTSTMVNEVKEERARRELI